MCIIVCVAPKALMCTFVHVWEEGLFILRKGTSVSFVWMPQWKLVGWREGLGRGQLDGALGMMWGRVP